MIRTVVAKWLWDARRSLVGWTVAVVVVGCGYAAFWPSFDSPQLQEALKSYPAALLEALNYTDIATAAGYLNATVYGLVVAGLMLVFAVSSGTRVIAGDEDAGTLDLVLAHPVSRRSVALQRFAGFAASVLGIVGVFWLAMLALAGAVGLDDITWAQLAAMHVHLALFAVLFGSVSFAVGAATGRKPLALAVGAGAGVLAYAAGGIIPQVDGLEWVKQYSAFFWLNGEQPLQNGLDVGHVSIMLGLSTALVVLGTRAFERRDVGV